MQPRAMLFAVPFVMSMSIMPAIAKDDPCGAKRADILVQIQQAQQKGNDQRVAGLQKALRAQEANCSPEKLRAAREKDVSQARAKLADREQELQEAKAEGKDKKKLAKREAKVQEAQIELQRAQDALGQ